MENQYFRHQHALTSAPESTQLAPKRRCFSSSKVTSISDRFLIGLGCQNGSLWAAQMSTKIEKKPPCRTSSPQDCLKTVQDHPKFAPGSTQMASRPPQETPRPPPRDQKVSKGHQKGTFWDTCWQQLSSHNTLQHVIFKNTSNFK